MAFTKALLAAISFGVFSGATAAEEFKIQVKSFIAPTKFEDIHSVEAGILEAITNANFSEDPQSGDSESADYRLWSEATLNASCSQGKLSAVDLSPASTNAGTELFALDAEGELEQQAQLSNLAPDDPEKIRRFSWQMRGRPNAAALAAFYVHDYRSCVWIWHRVEGTISCSGDNPTLEVKLTGSRFPSHRIWVNGTIKGSVDQGPFEFLWSCSQADASRVR